MAIGIQKKLRQNKIKNFWNWFSKNANQIVQARSGASGTLIEMQNKLHGISKYTIFELSLTENVDEEHMFTLSADGVLEGFQDVIDIVSAAPYLDGWHIKAFRQQKDVSGMKITVCGEDLSDEDISFTYFYDKDKDSDWINLNVYLSNITAITPELHQAVFLFLDAAIGEFIVGTRIGRVGIGMIEEYAAHEIESELMPLTKLAQVIEKEVHKNN